MLNAEKTDSERLNHADNVKRTTFSNKYRKSIEINY